MAPLTAYLIGIPALLLLSVVVSKGAGRYGVPGLLVFLLIGIVAGPGGLGGLPLPSLGLAQTLGILALAAILHSGGLDTRLADVRAVRASGLVLSTAGVLIATALVGGFAVWVLHFDWVSGLLLGATIAATDVAAVFTILRARSAALAGRIRPLLEFESALNDPMAVFLSVGLLDVLMRPEEASLVRLVPLFAQQMIFGAAGGFFAGRVSRWIINHIDLEFEGLYPVLSVAFVLLTFGLTTAVGGSGFLAVYVSGIVLGNSTGLHQRSLTAFHDGLAWLMQIAMFFTMGLLVRPSELAAVALAGVGLTAFLVLVARPVSVLACLAPFGYSLREQLMVSWGGLRGAVPIVLATYPLMAGGPGADMIFHLVFFVVGISVLVQGTSVPIVARALGVAAPLAKRFRYPIEYNPTTSLSNELSEIPVPGDSVAVGHTLVELALPGGVLVVLVRRGDDSFVPRGSTRIEADDTLLVLASPDRLPQARQIVAGHTTSM